ncbi:MAG: hypothetical protein HC851_04055 [Acaryochloris sp. RU_4_1]|nr:hypothetical protein [Acaryochloris sp. SU_5_25]NJM64885.1 hypothetical protein [Acaryochloris sp. RU_4_1]NJN38105.1 hypothetical protein [Acaryochloridaceae cyanobacterium CSU_3_4]NJR55153.1 hypothetical protein [Acaryochloris sp. CRU_2_0]
MDFPILNVVAVAALGMLVVVSVGMMYLTAAEWRDRRRRDREQRDIRRKRR